MNFIRGHDRSSGPQEGIGRGQGQSGQGTRRAREAGGPGQRGPARAPDAIKKYESLERDSKTQESEHAKARQSAQDARAEA